MTPAGAKHGAESAEVRKTIANPAQSKQRRGVVTGKEDGTKCGKSADKVRNLSDRSVSLSPPEPINAPDLVTPSLPKTQRKIRPAQPPFQGAPWPANAPRCQLPGLALHELAVIDAALAIVALKLREPGVACDQLQTLKEYMRLHLANADHERFCVLFLDAQHASIAFEVMFTGTLTQASVYPREVVRRALALNAHAVVLAHNHPSGNPEPSRADELLTQTLKSALALVDIRVLDHIVIGGMRSLSFAENGLM
jgi:DNA repair protein RadC